MRDYHLWKKGDKVWVVDYRDNKNINVEATVISVMMCHKDTDNSVLNMDQLYDGVLVVEMPDGMYIHVNNIFTFRSKEEIETYRKLYLVKGPGEDDLMEFLPTVPKGYTRYRWYGPEGVA